MNTAMPWARGWPIMERQLLVWCRGMGVIWAQRARHQAEKDGIQGVGDAFVDHAGLMQGMMAIVYTALGVPATTAIAIVLVFGGINAYLPLLVGFFFLREGRFLGGESSS